MDNQKDRLIQLRKEIIASFAVGIPAGIVLFYILMFL